MSAAEDGNCSGGVCSRPKAAPPPASCCSGGVCSRGLSSGTGMSVKQALASEDPEESKAVGNEQYKAGNFAEALALYDRAIALAPERAPYRANRAAALSGLGRLGEAVEECQEAVGLDEGYERAHQRLGSLKLRLGRFAEAVKHLRAAGDAAALKQAETAWEHAKRAADAEEKHDWSTMLKEVEEAIKLGGADSSSELLGKRAEALLHLKRLDEAEQSIEAAERAAAAESGAGAAAKDTRLLHLKAEVEAALGKFQPAVSCAEEALRLDPDNQQAAALLKKVRALSRARSTGNEHFTAGDWASALAAYDEGLKSGGQNAVLLANKAACLSKLGRSQEALAACNQALEANPSYSKARLRRAHAHKALGQWRECAADFEQLKKETPADMDIAREAFNAQKKLRRANGEDVSGQEFKPPGGVEKVESVEQFRQRISNPNLTVVDFFATWCGPCRQIAPVVESLSRKYPGVTFLKVDVDQLQQVAAQEGVRSMPTFKFYKNGKKVKEFSGASGPLLEQTIQQLL